MKRRNGLLAMALTGAVAIIPSTAAQAADKPNIVFVLMDNLGYGEVLLRPHRATLRQELDPAGL